jgi:hypothetical protein
MANTMVDKLCEDSHVTNSPICVQAKLAMVVNGFVTLIASSSCMPIAQSLASS